jgi:hypothetical protein
LAAFLGVIAGEDAALGVVRQCRPLKRGPEPAAISPVALPRRHWPLIGFAAGFLAVGVPYWAIPYDGAQLPSALLTPALAVVVAASAILRAIGAAPFWRIVGVVGASVPAVVMARVLVDTSSDPTSHNLWPFEAAIACGVGFACSLAGAIAGGGLAMLAARRRSGGTS